MDVIRAAIWVKQQSGNADFLDLPTTMKRALANWHANHKKLRELSAALPDYDLDTYQANDHPIATAEARVIFHPPVPDPATIRDFYAFEQHVKAARQLRGLAMDPEWYELPVFYFSNPNALLGHRAPLIYPAGTRELDFELEIAAIIGLEGRDIPAGDADYHIAGYTIMNDWSARDWQRREMKLNLGPAKGKDFATSLGPWLVTPDEFTTSHDDKSLNLTMTATLNGTEISHGNTADMYHPFPVLIAQASRNTRLVPGDIIGSGTVGTGCILELQPETTGGWLKPGDVVSLDIESLGTLTNQIIQQEEVI